MLIGIMADSHGEAGSLRAVLGYLAGLGCEALVHLGDVCDSGWPGTVDECVGLLRDAGALVVKGNNDHLVVKNNEDWPESPVSRGSLDWLRALPARLDRFGASFVHSQPFVEMMGLSAMVRSMEEAEYRAYFSQEPGGILFRGHSHDPALARPRQGGVRVRGVPAGEVMELSRKRPCAITCGSLMQGFAMLYDDRALRVTCLRMEGAGG
ncbi:MAG: metallophosphoesterase family protein [Thermodesulfobacteriota bacterium]